MGRRNDRASATRSLDRLRAGSALRVAVVLGALVAVSCWALARAARAQLSHAALSVGEALSRIDPPEAVVHRLQINGEVLHLLVETVEVPVPSVLDQAEAVCRTGRFALDEWTEIADRPVNDGAATSPREVPQSWPLLRRETPRQGIVACLVPAPRVGREDQVARLVRFGETGDLAALGRFQYVYARRLGIGRTQRMLVYNPARFRMLQLFAKGDEDAPGGDLRGVPRPQRAVRLLTASLESTAHDMAVYRVTSDGAHALDNMSHRLASQGWQAVPLPAPVTEQARAYQRRALDLLLLAAPLEDGTALTLVRSRPR